MTVVVALLSAALFGCGVALQQRPAREMPERYAGKLRILVELSHRPLWLLGLIGEIGGFALQVDALRNGSLVLVQPVITTSLLFTIGVAARFSGQTIGLRDWVAAVAVVFGLAVFLVVAAPKDGGPGVATSQAWGVTGACLFGVAVALVATGFAMAGRARAVLFGMAAGLGDGSVSVVTKAFAHNLQRGPWSALATWTPYVLVLVGLGALTLSQTAYQTGRPTVTLPIIVAADPLVACAIGVGIFGETLRVGSWRGPGVALAALIMAGGLAVLARSSLVIEPSGDAVGGDGAPGGAAAGTPGWPEGTPQLKRRDRAR